MLLLVLGDVYKLPMPPEVADLPSDEGISPFRKAYNPDWYKSSIA